MGLFLIVFGPEPNSLLNGVLSSTRVSSSGSGASVDSSSPFAQPAGTSVALLQPPFFAAAHSREEWKGSQCVSRGVESKSLGNNSLAKASSFDPLVPATSHWIYELKRRPCWQGLSCRRLDSLYEG